MNTGDGCVFANNIVGYAKVKNPGKRKIFSTQACAPADSIGSSCVKIARYSIGDFKAEKIKIYI